MGCDIHIIVEKRENGQWIKVDPPVGFRDGFWLRMAEKADDEKRKETYLNYWRTGWPTRRNYSLFAILANVRNEGLKPLAEPRGLPLDLIDIVDGDGWYGPKIEDMGEDEEDPRPWLGGHSHTWFSLEELMLVDWEASATGYIPNTARDEEEYPDHTYREVAGDFLEIVEQMHSLGLPEDVRILIGFDS